MVLNEELQRILSALPEERLRQVLDFAQFLEWQEERRDWQGLGLAHLAGLYGPNEPEYTEADLKPGRPS